MIRPRKKAKNPPRQRIAAKIERLQSGWAQWMSRQAGKLSTRMQKVALWCFVLAGVAYCALLVIGPGPLLRSSGSIVQPKVPKLEKNTQPLKQETVRIQHFRRYLDSLNQTTAGREIRDSILAENPGLIDSLTFWERMLGE